MAGKQNPKVQHALKLLADDPKMTIYAATKASGAVESSVYAAVARQKVLPADVEGSVASAGAVLEGIIAAGGHRAVMRELVRLKRLVDTALAADQATL